MLEIINGLWSFLELFVDVFKSSISFIGAFFTTLPNLLINIFNNLPSVFKYGIEGMIGVMLMIVLGKFIAIFIKLK